MVELDTERTACDENTTHSALAPAGDRESRRGARERNGERDEQLHGWLQVAPRTSSRSRCLATLRAFRAICRAPNAYRDTTKEATEEDRRLAQRSRSPLKTRGSAWSNRLRERGLIAEGVTCPPGGRGVCLFLGWLFYNKWSPVGKVGVTGSEAIPTLGASREGKR